MGSNSDWGYVFMGLIVLFLVGGLSYIASEVPHGDLESPDGGYLSPAQNFIAEGHNFNITIPLPIIPDLNMDFNFNPFGILGGTIQNFLSSEFDGFILLPKFISIPLIIIVTICLLIAVLKVWEMIVP
jgi:hypothetical protein